MSKEPFAHLPFTAEAHFRLYFYGALVQIFEKVFDVFDSPEAAFEEFPFLESYFGELAANGLDQTEVEEAGEWWEAALRDWEGRAEGHFFPLCALARATGLDYAGLTLLVAVNLGEEDRRFGQLFETIQQLPGQRRPVRSLLSSWWEAKNGRKLLVDLQAAGLVEVCNPEAPRPEQALQSPPLVWDAIRGEFPDHPTNRLEYRPPHRLTNLADLILPGDLRDRVTGLPGLLAAGQVQTIVVRGPRHNGRFTLLEGLARQLGRGVLKGLISRTEIEALGQVGPLAVLLNALPVLVLETGGETVDLPALYGYHGPVGLVMSQESGLTGPLAELALTFKLPMPDYLSRLSHWQRIFPAQTGPELESLARHFRMTGGNIRRVANLAQSYARLEGSAKVSMAHVRASRHALNHRQLENLATHIPVSGDWSHLAVGPATLTELANLENRCRCREQMPAIVGPALSGQLNAGVRALFSGPSGTGKTLAACLLAAALQMDLYRLDLASVVNKYIGETEKRLQEIFARAEELDIILLLDEGDALLTRRTSVQNSNDRYANLETNYLLQRLESYEGILLVTTNAGDRIDSAFQRRMDVVVEFHLPDPVERLKIWELHLPPGHLAGPAFLFEVANRCHLSGGQIRNAVLHAALLALSEGNPLGSCHLEAAIWREYRKVGQNCPLRRNPALAYLQE